VTGEVYASAKARIDAKLEEESGKTIEQDMYHFFTALGLDVM
jgi:hypothetical protein